MILVIFAVFVALIGLSILGYYMDWDYDIVSVIGVIGVIGFAISLIVLIINMHAVVHISVIDDEIAMYQEENTKIEMELAECVEFYMEHEEKIITEVAPESAVTLVALYPELKSDILVSYLMDTYVTNSEQIKELRAKQIKGETAKWWLYFGGNGVDW